MSCKIVEKKIRIIAIRLFDEEIEEAEFLSLSQNLSYEQLFIKLIKKELGEE